MLPSGNDVDRGRILTMSYTGREAAVLYHRRVVPAPPMRVLLVDDFQPYRALIVSLLTDHTDFDIVGEASDGVEALARAQELTPDVIIMDIGLPKPNGFEAARRVG